MGQYIDTLLLGNWRFVSYSICDITLVPTLWSKVRRGVVSTAFDWIVSIGNLAPLVLDLVPANNMFST